MLSPEMNERLTGVGAGTPCGNLLRCYWHPVAAAAELDASPVKRVRLLGEDLILYRDRSGTYGLVDERCPHRRASLEFGVPEAEGIRCAYHGWQFAANGSCIAQPGEPWNSTFKDNVAIKAYPVEALGGLIFAYLGPQPAPLLPRYELLVRADAMRRIGLTDIACNWLQCVENSADPIHVEWLHGRFMDDIYQRRNAPLAQRKPSRHKRIGFDVSDLGLVKRRLLEGQTEDVETWQVGHPLIFPNILYSNNTLQFRVPVDDTHTHHVLYQIYPGAASVPHPETVGYYEIPLRDANGRYNVDTLVVQDFVAWMSQGEIARRDLERLGQSDVGVIMYRGLLAEQIDRVERGEEPALGIFRDPAANSRVVLREARIPFNGMKRMPESERIQEPWVYEKFDPARAEIVAFLRESERLSASIAQAPDDDWPPVPIDPRRHRSVQLLPEQSAPAGTMP